MIAAINRTEFPKTAPVALPVFFRTYSRYGQESWDQMCDRTIPALAKLGRFTAAQTDLVSRMQRSLKTLPAGRWLWIGGSDWLEKPENVSGAYNCTSTEVTDWRAFGLMMDLAMMGCGTGAVLEPSIIDQLPEITTRLVVEVIGQPGDTPKENRLETTTIRQEADSVLIRVGDSRKGWVSSYVALLELSSTPQVFHSLNVTIDVSDVRPSGEQLNGFGGRANPIRLPGMYTRVAKVLNKAVGRQLNSVECSLLIDEASTAVVAGNIRRAAGIRQGNSADEIFAVAKDDLWQQDDKGNWRIDPDRDALRMANHTRVYHSSPTEEECIKAVQKQVNSGEGAIQYAPEAIARSSRDLWASEAMRREFIDAYEQGNGENWLRQHFPEMSQEELLHRLRRFGLNPCAEVLGSLFHCNLSEIHLNMLDPFDLGEQEEAFTAGGLAVAALLNHEFTETRYQRSRELDPIVGVSFTGLFDFFVHSFGVDWLRWWAAGRVDFWNGEHSLKSYIDGFSKIFPELQRSHFISVGEFFVRVEQLYLARWQEVVRNTVWGYCDDHGLKRPNRFTVVQPAGTKSLLTGASPGWHPPKSQRFIRRVTFGKNDPVALACMEMGFSVVPSQSDKDEAGNLLNDPFDVRCTEWLVEIPVEVAWANLPGADEIQIDQFSALAQLKFWLQVQQYWTLHNTSATIEVQPWEVEETGRFIYESIRDRSGYVSVAILSRFNAPFPRLPFEKITRKQYLEAVEKVRQQQKMDDFQLALQKHQGDSQPDFVGPAACDSDRCLMPEAH